jgi:polyferredoxin
MVKVGLPKGLIRYATEDEIEKELPFKFTNRMKAYSAVLLLMVGFLGFLLSNRGTMEAKFIKPAGSSYFVRDGNITNIYNYTFLNKSTKNQVVTVKIIEPEHGKVTLSGEDKIMLKKDQITKGTVNISFPEKEVTVSKQKVKIGVYDTSGKLLDSFDTYFEGPFKIQF